MPALAGLQAAMPTLPARCRNHVRPRLIPLSPAGQRSRKLILKLGANAAPAEFLDGSQGALREGGVKAFINSKVHNKLGQLPDVAEWVTKAVDAITHRTLRHARTGNNRYAVGICLERHDAESFDCGWDDQDARCA